MKGLTTPGMLDNTYDLLVNSPSTGSGSNLWSQLTGSDNIFGLIRAITNRITAEHMTGADREAADLSYQQQEQFFNDYQSIPAQVQQSIDAGLNPALMYGKGATPMSPIAGNAQASQASLDPMAFISGIVGLGIQAQEAKANIALKMSQANLTNTQSDLAKKDLSAFAERLERERGSYDLAQRIGNKNIEEIDARIAVENAQVDLFNADIDKKEAETTFIEYQQLLAQIDLSYRDQLNSALLRLRTAQANYQDAQRGRIKQEIDYWDKIKDERVEAFNQQLEKLKNEKVISDNEVKYWLDEKKLEAISIIAGAYADTKDEFHSFIAGWSKHNNHNINELGLGSGSFSIDNFFNR